MKTVYVAGARFVRRFLGAVGLLGWLERRSDSSRLALWLRSLMSIFDAEDLARLGVPWWTFKSIDRVQDFLAEVPDARVFEWGSGASTVWLSHRAGSVRTVEHDAEWARSISTLLSDRVHLVLVPATQLSGSGGVRSDKAGQEGLDFSAYVDAIDRDDTLYDLIVIDGRAREACLVRALDHLAPGGLVVFDNVDRERYRAAIAASGPLDVIWTRGLTPSLPYPTRTALLSRSA